MGHDAITKCKRILQIPRNSTPSPPRTNPPPAYKTYAVAQITLQEAVRNSAGGSVAAEEVVDSFVVVADSD